MPELTTEAEKTMIAMTGVAKVGTDVSLAIHNAILAGGDATRNVADVLHGKWLGHPLHPVLTDITIGALVMGGVFDVVGEVTDNPSIQNAGDRLAEAGTLSAIPTALTGLTDFSTFPEWSATPATLHGAMNIVNIGLFALSIRERRRGNHGRGVAISLAAIGLTCVSAWLGGMLVYKDKVGVDHRDRFSEPKKWTPVLDEDELPNKTPKRVEVDGKPVMVYRDGRKVYAIGAVCSHAGGPLDEGKVENGCVTCPWHDSVFDMRDGHIVHGPATFPQPRFAGRLHDGKVEIRVVEG
jgi:nitrite reductase/ring-hydroxylating ferredoxin subunit/uncharacterized membrane protein